MSDEFTEHGAHVLAQGLRQSNVGLIFLRINWGFQAVAESISRILYLEGNRPLIATDSYSLNLTFDCLRLQQNDIRLTHYKLRLGSDDISLFGNALRENTVLQCLEIRGWRARGEPDFTVDEARALAEGICLSQVKELSLYDGEFNNDFLRIIFEYGIRASGRMFDVSARLEDSSTLACIQSSVTTLCLHRTESNSPSLNIDALSQFLGDSSSLTCLKLWYCELGDEGMRILAQGLHRNRSIRRLGLTNNGIGDDGLVSLVQAWPDDSPIVSLELGRNRFGDAGLRELLLAIARHRHGWEELSIFQCTNLTQLGLQLIAHEMPHMTLKILDISQCFLKKRFSATEKAAQMAWEEAAANNWQSVLDGIRSNCHLHCFNVFGNYLSGTTLQKMRLYTTLNRHGRQLLSNRDNPSTIWCNILAKCWKDPEFHHSMIFFFLIEQPQLVPPSGGAKRTKGEVGFKLRRVPLAGNMMPR